MKAMPTIAAPPPRAASTASDMAAIDAGSEAGDFAAALDLARDPAKSVLERPVKSAARASSAADPASTAKPPAATPSRCDRADDAAPDASALEESPSADDPAATEPPLLLPGWPASLPAVAALAVDAAAEIDAESALGGAAQALASLPGLATSAPMPRALRHATTTVLPAVTLAAASPQSSQSAAGASVVPAAADLARPAPAQPVADLASVSAPAWSGATTPAPAAPLQAAPVPGPAATPFAAHLAAAVDSPAFAPALASQVNWLVREGLHLARLTLNPADMGPVAVKITLDGAQARVDFHAAIASTRTAIEASLPALAAALHDSGLTLVGGGVSDGQARHGAAGDRGSRAQDPGAAAGTSAALPTPTEPHRVARGLVDLVA